MARKESNPDAAGVGDRETAVEDADLDGPETTRTDASAQPHREDAERRFPYGRGQDYTQAGTGNSYPTATFADVVTLAAQPQERVNKLDGLWAIFSTYAGDDARSQVKQRNAGQFGVLPVDFDSGDASLESVVALFEAILPGVRALVYATRSSKTGARRWRALIELLDLLPGSAYASVQGALFAAITAASGLVPDPKMARASQIIFLPNKGKHYEYALIEGTPLDLAGHPLLTKAEEGQAEREAAEAVTRADRERRQRERAARIETGELTAIDHYNADHPVEEMLTLYGYTQSDRHPDDWRSPLQTSDSYATRTYDDGRWISLSGSDREAGLGRPSADGSCCSGDSFDLFTYFEHDGDADAAIRAYVSEAGLDDNSTVGGSAFSWGAKPEPEEPAEEEPEPEPEDEPAEEPDQGDEQNSPKGSPNDGPIPLIPEVPPALPFPVEALGPILAPAAAAIAAKVQVPSAVAAQAGWNEPGVNHA